jgi:hypothetical protein
MWLTILWMHAWWAVSTLMSLPVTQISDELSSSSSVTEIVVNFCSQLVCFLGVYRQWENFDKCAKLLCRVYIYEEIRV